MDKALTQITQSLEQIKKISNDTEFVEFWSARDLMLVLSYDKWENFLNVIKKAKIACGVSGNNALNHFPDIRKMVDIGSGAQKEVADILLTRFACYLIAQNGDPRKPQVALAQTYFATQTRKQELLEAREKENKRLDARVKLKATENKIESTVFERGIKLPVEFASFKNKHIEALYGGIPAKKLKQMRNIPQSRSLADFDSHVELSAKEFALAMTDHNIKVKNIKGKEPMTYEVVKNSKATRQTLLSRGIKPELIKPEEDLKKIQKRRVEEIKKISPL